jgi:surface protein
MFTFAISFNQNIGSWNVSNVANMTFMFNGATVFNNGGNNSINNWNTSKVTNMSGMFAEISGFNQPIGSWKTGNVTASGMNFMFYDSRAFNQNLSTWCVTNILSKPSQFDSLATAWTLPSSRPVWGTCPP